MPVLVVQKQKPRFPLLQEKMGSEKFRFFCHVDFTSSPFLFEMMLSILKHRLVEIPPCNALKISS